MGAAVSGWFDRKQHDATEVWRHPNDWLRASISSSGVSSCFCCLLLWSPSRRAVHVNVSCESALCRLDIFKAILGIVEPLTSMGR